MTSKYKDMAARIRALPALLGVSVAEFCDKANIKTQSYSSYQRGVSKPGADAIASIVAAWAVNPYWLLLGEGEVMTLETILDNDVVRYTEEDFSIVAMLRRIRDLEDEIKRLKAHSNLPARPKPYPQELPQPGAVNDTEGED